MHGLRLAVCSMGRNGIVELGAGDSAEIGEHGVGVGGCVEADGWGEYDEV